MFSYTTCFSSNLSSVVLAQVLSIALSALVIAVNIFFVLTYVSGLSVSSSGWFIFLCVVVGNAYLAFCAYLAVDMVINMAEGGAGRPKKKKPGQPISTHLN